jgi:hypothetical protein
VPIAFRRRLAALVPLLSVCAGCAWAASLKARETTVYFDRASTLEQRVAAREACLSFPHITAEPVATDSLSHRAQTEIRYRVDDASDYDLGQLNACLAKQPMFKTIQTVELNGGNNG